MGLKSFFAGVGCFILPVMGLAADSTPPVETTAVSHMDSRTKNPKRDPGTFGDYWWANRFLSRSEAIRKVRGDEVDLVLLGDSICHFWEWQHPDSWAKLTAGRKVLNLGYGGDTTQQVIWRVEHGELDGYTAKTVVLMIGTNNNSSNKSNPTNVALGVEKIVGMIRQHQPTAKVVLHPIFPRGASSNSVHHARARLRNDVTNGLLRDFAARDGNLVWIDFNDKLVDETGWVPKSLMADAIHPTDAGYDIWMQALSDAGILPKPLADAWPDVVVETSALKLTIKGDATAKSLIVKATGEEMLEPREGIPVFASTQIRPFNNEIRLVQQAKRTTYPANRIRREGDRLVLGFETAPYEVVVRVTESPAGYVAFQPVELRSNTTDEHQYYHWNLDVPPIDSFRLLQLPIKNRKNFGDWLNVMWDDTAFVGVLGGTPYMDVDNEKRFGFRNLTVEALKSYGVTNGIAVLTVAAEKRKFLDQIDAVERDLGLPRGIQSRSDSRLNASLFWVSTAFRPENIDAILKYMKLGGFRMLLIYYPSIVRAQGYNTLPDYTLDHGWTYEKLRAALDRLHKAGISVGLHTLQTFIGLASSYVTPEADPRLAIIRHYTLSRPIAVADAPGEIFVEENPIAAPMQEKIRVLRFGTELFTYTGYTTTRPYKFTGVKRGHRGTTAKDHPYGEIGGVLGISECAAVSAYVDQDSSLQDEVAEKIADIYACGLDFLYFDGSEDANVPCTVNISLSQLRCVDACTRRTGRAPLFTEGCAKSHFGWHVQSGANAFDVFGPEIFKAKIIEYPFAAAQRLAKDFTRVDFGWWGFWVPKLDGEPALKEGLYRNGRRTVGTQADIWEYGTSKAAAFDCPSTMQMNLDTLAKHKRTGDILETMRRWEDVRLKKWLTPAQKEMLKDPAKEFHLYLNEKGEYELIEWRQLAVAGDVWSRVRAFVFARNGQRVVAYWDVADKSELTLANGAGTLKAENLTYWTTPLTEPQIRDAFLHASIRDL